MMRTHYAAVLIYTNHRKLDDFREAVTMLEDTERIARRVLGGAHPTTERIELSLQHARAALRARETPS
jgi:ABC-type oligopeptide transport system substrate-binding subunit